ncbi:hypothetical protein P4O66_007278, partial [Electrophorus voltai]
MHGKGRRVPGAEVGEPHGTTSDYHDWYNDFQSWESDTVDFSRTTKRPLLILTSLNGSYGDQTGCDDQYSEVDSTGFSGNQPNYEDRYSKVESAGTCMEHREGYVEYGKRGECSDIALESDMGSDREEDSSMEVEEVPQEDPSSQNDTIGSKDEETPAPKAPPKAPPRASHSGASKQPRATGREATWSAEKETPPPKTRSTKVHAPTPKLRGGKKAAAPELAPQPGNTNGTLPYAHVPGSRQPPTTEQ